MPTPKKKPAAKSIATKFLGPKEKWGKENVMAYSEIKVHPVLQQHLGYMMTRTALLLRCQMEETLAELGVKLHHFGIIQILASGEDYNQNKLGEELGVDKASMVKVIDELEKAGFVERVSSKEDRRVKFVHLTAKGKKVNQVGADLRKTKEKENFGVLSADELAQLKSSILKLYAHVSALPKKA